MFYCLAKSDQTQGIQSNHLVIFFYTEIFRKPQNWKWVEQGKNWKWNKTSEFRKGSGKKKPQAQVKKRHKNAEMTQINSKEPQHNNFRQNKGMGAFLKNSDLTETSKFKKGSVNKKAQAQVKKGTKTLKWHELTEKLLPKIIRHVLRWRNGGIFKKFGLDRNLKIYKRLRKQKSSGAGKKAGKHWNDTN
jgi:hypothetical protein